jgi:hypothetical protein
MSKPVLTNLDMSNASRILNLPAPVAATEPVRLQDLNAAIEGVKFKDDVEVLTSANVNISAPGAALDAITMTTGMRVALGNQTALSEIGLYIWNGPAIALTRSLDANTMDELENALFSVKQGSSAGLTYRQTTIGGTLGSSAIAFVPFGNVAPPASTTTSGIQRNATQGEVDAGTLTNATVVPATLKNTTLFTKKYAVAVGDGTSTLLTITHSLNTRDVTVQVYRATAPYDEVLIDIERPTVNTVDLRFVVAPAASAYRAVVTG